MMRCLLVLLSIAPLLVACGHLPRSIDRVALVDQLVQQQEYGQARRELADLDTSDPQFAALANRRRALRPLIQQFEANTVRESEQLQRRNQWVEALAVIDNGLQKLVDSDRLQAARGRVLLGRDRYLEAIETELQLRQGELLAKQQTLLERRAKAKPGNIRYRLELWRQRRKSADITDQLIACASGQSAGSALAADCLKVAESLDQSPEQAQRLAQLRSGLQSKKMIHTRPPRSSEPGVNAQRELSVLKQEYRDLVDARWWPQAQQKMLELQARAPAGDKEVETWSLKLQESIDSEVQLFLKLGQTYYSQGSLQRALQAWRYAADLAPDDQEVQAHIGRVQRFLEKLQRLDAAEG
ncbi:hypothetical protein FKG94_05475 [Exilibacterium tricleocarpae]|uniref:Uncharacterized protein n=1 Tax=Exilibacterium tricleocarpae TaxID=2591008 RepID=A0A545U3V1_9GAMM|nr:hypothetical protein [Exilibacterium tricleocarpae]TQV84114.1 hypothetical protein FKG94_05475 [Exilibacterium tricleocarpae]